MSRLGIFASRAGPSKPGPSSPLNREDEDPDDDWYIPYNGPIEQPPKNNHDAGSRDSWGEMLHEVLSEEEDEGRRGAGASPRDARQSHAASAPEQDRSRGRAVSNASRQTKSTGAADSRRNTNARAPHLRQNPQQRRPTMSFVNPDQLGGVGDTPTPIERTAPHTFPPAPEQRENSAPSSRRTSLASIFTFGRRKSLRMSASADNLARERAQSSAQPEPPLPTATPRSTIGRARANTTLPDATRGRMSHEDEYYNSYYATLLATPGRENGPASEPSSLRSHPYAYPFPQPETAEPQSAPAAVDKGKGRLVVPRINFLDARTSKVPAYLKPSPRNSLLKASMSTPNLKGRQRWLAAETWCDAIILPRPRFALKLEATEATSGRIVSPPPSPVLPGNSDESGHARPGPAAQHAAMTRARSMSRVGASPPPPKQEPAPTPPPAEASTSRNLRPPRPKSWAWDDLALPSPVPSLAKVLEEGRQLEEERKVWQASAGKSYLDRRANNVSRARSKSIGAPRNRPRPRSRSGERKAFEALAEKTLLGNQTRPPTIHVRSASGSKASHHTHSQSQTQSATAHGTFQSMASRPFSRSGTGSRTMRSHAHSNSVGNTVSTARSDEVPSAAGGGSSNGHSRNHSFGKSAFKIVVSTANSAAAFCGLTSPTGEKGLVTPLDENPGTMDNGFQTTGTRNIRLQDQMRAEQARSPGSDHLLVIAPNSPTGMVNPNSSSPTPSGMSGSGEVGIAILPPDDSSRQYRGREPIRIPAHPYAQGSGYAPHPVLSTSPESYTPSSPTRANRAVEEPHVNMHRQPVQVHPYAQAHPYATPTRPRPPNLSIPLNDTLYAELSPGHVREVNPEDIRYSPEIPPPTVVTGKQSLQQLRGAAHPYAEESKRTSELVFGDVLMRTMRRPSIDSGIGTSDYGEHEREVDWRDRTTEPEADAVEDIVRIHGASGSRGDVRSTDTRPSPYTVNSGGMQSNHTVASSPIGHVNPPTFRRMATDGSGSGSGRGSLGPRLGHSSGSSPGMVSHDSSPPLSPRPLDDTPDDLERFRNLFYRPSNSNSSESMAHAADRPGVGSRRPSGSIPFDVSSRSTRSGLSTLARQLSEDLEDLRNLYTSQDSEDVSSDEPRMWGRRHGGLTGPRSDDLHDEPPNMVLARFNTSSSHRSGYDSPVRLPIDTSFVAPTTNIPEDVESSRASSVFEMSPLHNEDRPQELLRVGSIEAVSTPPVIYTPQRHSHDVSLIGHSAPTDEADAGSDTRRDSEFLDPRLLLSARSTLLSQLSPVTRSSYMTSNTDTSRMSGLSDFPAPPTDVSPSSLAPPAPLRIVREPSLATFGRQDSASSEYGPIGEAL
ncbi:hypothetical protein PsYK624_014150 [Phanerochaete sordida]|uniref:Uncharacterized protein n=1 Tax=Phanerochaete sordida TaxID=48140 RepID=A0A9P3FZB4_9APHY|nr:hypothetical protein PsYK624_014150 [Phanerochaete sordida]